jgi:nickel-dependent lactate racemase
VETFEVPYTVDDGIQKFKGDFPSSVRVEFLSGVFPVPLTRTQISCRLTDAIEAYVKTQPARQHRGVVVVEDDSRPSRLAVVLDTVLDCLEELGWGSREITVLIASGAHGPSGEAALRWKLGERVVANYTIVQHRATDCQPTGIPFQGGQLELNSAFLQAGWIIMIGSCLPHPFAGFGGGFKLIVPGIASLENIVAFHKLAFLGGRPHTPVNDAPHCRELIHALVTRLRPVLSIVCLIDYAGEVADLYAGDSIASYREAVKAARSLYKLSDPVKPYDVLLLNCYPKDRNLIQCMNSLAFYARHDPWVKDDGLVILTALGVRQAGVHRVLGPGGRLYRSPGKIKSLDSRRLWFYAPELPQSEYSTIFSEEYPLIGSWSQLVERLDTEFPKDYSVGIVPAAALHV